MTNPILIALTFAAVVAAALLARTLMFRRNRSRYQVTEFSGFLSAEECEHIIGLAIPLVKESGILRNGQNKTGSALRTSDSAFFEHSRDAVVLRIKKRIAEASNTNLRCQEPLQVTHYDTTQYFAPHFDSLATGGGGTGAAGDRQCTMIIYLNDDFTGGETQFHRIGVRIKPERGKAILFTNLQRDGTAPDPLSRHGARAVRSGDKWLLNQWIRQRPFSTPNRSARRGKAKKRRSAAR